MTGKLFASGLFAGLAAGLIVVLLQFFLTEPLILEAEAYESGAKVHFAGVPAAAEPATEAGHQMHMNEDPEDVSLFHRFSLAFAADFIVFVAWGLIMVSGFLLAERFGHRITLKNGLLWGVAGYVAVHVAPGIGLAPELPGIPAADLHARQIWWVGTVMATAAALALMAFGRNPLAFVAGLVLLVVPHVIGAPELEELRGLAPPSLAGEYAARSNAVGMAGWVMLGLAAAFFWNRSKTA